MKIKLIFYSVVSLVAVSCQNKFEKTISNHFDNYIFKGEKLSYEIIEYRFDTLTHVDNELEYTNSSFQEKLKKINYLKENIDDNNILISKIKEAKIVKPHLVNLYAFKNTDHGIENEFFEVTPFTATTKKKDILKLKNEINIYQEELDYYNRIIEVDKRKLEQLKLIDVKASPINKIIASVTLKVKQNGILQNRTYRVILNKDLGVINVLSIN